MLISLSLTSPECLTRSALLGNQALVPSVLALHQAYPVLHAVDDEQNDLYFPFIHDVGRLARWGVLSCIFNTLV